MSRDTLTAINMITASETRFLFRFDFEILLPVLIVLTVLTVDTADSNGGNVGADSTDSTDSTDSIKGTSNGHH